MGIVYRAEHAETGGEAAIKTVTTVDAAMLQGIRLEILALAALAHPGIVRILDHGVEDGVPWYAMELIRGVSLAGETDADYSAATTQYALSGAKAAGSPGAPAEGDVSHRWWTTELTRRTADSTLAHPRTAYRLPAAPPPHAAITAPALAAGSVARTLTVARRLCWTLAYLHGEGVVHRDLKPANVVLRRNGTPVIVDFGLTTHFAGRSGREGPLFRSGAVGSACYMSPEQVRGELVDARADLYSFGCLLYYLLAGRPPFVSAHSREVLRSHLAATPPRLSELVRGIPSALDEMAAALLAKQPQDRIGHASDVAAILSAFIDEEDPWIAQTPAPRPYLYRSSLVGRTYELMLGREALARAAEGAGSVFALFGESGAGKTRLLLELAREADAGGLIVLFGECLELSSAPLQGLRRPLQAIADHCRAGGIEATERLLAGRARILASFQPALADLPGQAACPPPPPLTAEAARERLFACLTQTILALTAEGPVVLIVEDLHWADELTRAWISSAAKNQQLRAAACLILVSFRQEEVDDAVLALLDEGAIAGCCLHRLDERGTAQIVADMLGVRKPPMILTHFLITRCEGNPFFIAEYLRVAVAEGCLWRDGLGIWQVDDAGEARGERSEGFAVSLPAAIEAVIERRLSMLTPPARALAEVAAVLGQEIELTLLELLAAREHLNTSAGLAELLRRDVLEEDRPGVLRFGHDRIRHAAYGRLDAPRRWALHAEVARCLQACRQPDLDGRHGSPAMYWEGGGGRAGHHAIAAARAARSQYAHTDAERLFRDFLRLAPRPSRETVSARLDLATQVLMVQGRTEEALTTIAEATSEARALGDPGAELASSLALGNALWLTCRPGEARALLTDLLPLARSQGDRRSEVTILGLMGNIDLEQCRWSAAEGRYAEAAQLAEALADEREQGVIALNRGVVQAKLGRLADAVPALQRAAELHRRGGNKRLEAAALGNLGHAYLIARDLSTAEATLLAALERGREAGSRSWEAIAVGLLGDVSAGRGEVAEAWRRYEESEQLAQQCGESWWRALCLLAMARLSRRGDEDPVRAAELLDRAQSELAVGGFPFELGLCQAERVHIELAAGTGGATAALVAAESAALALDAPQASELGQAVARARRAHDARAAHGAAALLRGEVPADLPAALRSQARAPTCTVPNCTPTKVES
ncbi:MAG: AAA family ATPase [Candidatus Schekmanbacteria bacterium]|nr:AAA family ATPase [Candidatus Schekmanbacteria bacterium]